MQETGKLGKACLFRFLSLCPLVEIRMLLSPGGPLPQEGFMTCFRGEGKGEKVLPHLPFLKFLQFEIVSMPRCTYFQNILNPINYLELSVLRFLRKELNIGELQRWSCNSSLKQTRVLYWQTYVSKAKIFSKNATHNDHTAHVKYILPLLEKQSTEIFYYVWQL